MLRGLRAYAVYAVLAAMVALPVSVERAIEGARFDDRLGTFPVEVTLSHNGYSTINAGLIGETLLGTHRRRGTGRHDLGD